MATRLFYRVEPKDNGLYSVVVSPHDINKPQIGTHVADFGGDHIAAEATAASLNDFEIQRALFNDDQDPQEFLIDTITALLHWAASHGLSFDEARMMAGAHFVAERHNKGEV